MWIAKLKICLLFLNANFVESIFSSVTPTIFVVTDITPSQTLLPEVIRLGNTLNLIENITWVVISPSLVRPEVQEYLDRLKIKFKVLVELSGDKRTALDTGLKWIKSSFNNGVVYFASTDYVLNTKLFDEVRSTSKISMFPVGLSSSYQISSPVIEDGQFIGYCADNPNNETYPIDLAGVAFNLGFLKERNARFDYIIANTTATADLLMKSMGEIGQEDIEIKANMATRILVWRNPFEEAGAADKHEIVQPIYKDTNLVELEKLLY